MILKIPNAMNTMLNNFLSMRIQLYMFYEVEIHIILLITDQIFGVHKNLYFH